MTTLRHLLRAGSKLEGAAEDFENLSPVTELAASYHELQNDLRLVWLKLVALIERERTLPK